MPRGSRHPHQPNSRYMMRNGEGTAAEDHNCEDRDNYKQEMKMA